jgi:hypothetical protein
LCAKIGAKAAHKMLVKLTNCRHSPHVATGSLNVATSSIYKFHTFGNYKDCKPFELLSINFRANINQREKMILKIFLATKYFQQMW